MGFLKETYLRLRAPEPSDSRFIYDCENDTDEWLSSSVNYTPVSLTQIEEHIRCSINDPFSGKEMMLILEDHDQSKKLGILEITSLNPVHGTAEIGFYIIPEERGKGIGFILIDLALDYCINFLGLKSVIAHTTQKNRSSQIILEKNGFNNVGKLHAWMRTSDGKRDDVLIYQFIEEANCRKDS